VDLEAESPFAVVVVIDLTVDSEWRHIVSEWLVDQGCLYMMAHGHECSLWDDSVDIANLEVFDWNFDEIPEHKLVTTTWHENETLDEVFFFAKNCALPFSPLIESIIILDITENSREQDMLVRYEEANEEDVIDKTDYLDLYESLWRKFIKASSGPFNQRLAFMGPILIIMILCLLLWGLVDFL
jgi:hypothetical protein